MFLKLVQATSLAVLLALFPTSALEASPSSLMVAQSCSAAGMELTIAWTNGAGPVLQQYVNVSRDNNGWTPGTFSLSGPFAADVNSMRLPGLSLGVPYYVRVNQLLESGAWEASETLTVSPNSTTANTCAPSPQAVAIPPPIIAAPAPATPPASTAPPAPDSPSELISWLQSVGVLSQPTIQSFVRDAVAAFQQPAAMPGQLP